MTTRYISNDILVDANDDLMTSARKDVRKKFTNVTCNIVIGDTANDTALIFKNDIQRSC